MNQTNAPVYIRADQFVTTCSVINVKNAMSLDNEPVSSNESAKAMDKNKDEIIQKAKNLGIQYDCRRENKIVYL